MNRITFAIALSLVVAASCDDSDEVSSETEARLAYVGLDRAVDRSLNLGMQGFNTASSANISPQTGNGDVTGTLVVTGQVDQGVSDNKEMRLFTAFTMYEDRLAVASADAGVGEESDIVYNTSGTALPALNLSLRNIPMTAGAMGTFTGTLIGKVAMSGDLEGDVTLNLTFAGSLRLQSSGSGIERVPGSTHVTGTAVSRYGVYTVDLMR